jgi:hypothetical protein
MEDVEHFLVGIPKGGSGNNEVVVLRTTKAIKATDIVAAKQGSSFKEEKVNGNTVYHSDRGSMSFCVAESKVVIYGQLDRVKEVLERNKKPRFTTGLETALKQADFSDTIAFAADVREVGQGFALGPMTRENTEGVAGSIQIKSDVRARVIALCKDSQSAADIKKWLDGELENFKKIAPGVLQKILDDVSISTSGSKVQGKLQFKVGGLVKAVRDIRPPGR